MRKFVVIFVMMAFAFPMKAQQDNIIVVEKKDDSSSYTNKHRKAGSNWTVQFAKTDTRSSMIGIVSDGDCLYAGSPSKNMIYKIGFDGKVIDSVTITGMPGASSSVSANMVGLAYDGTNFYMVNGNDNIYQIDYNKKKVTSTVSLTNGKNPVGITYAPDADGGNGGFWVSFVSSPYDLCLYSRTGTVLSTITNVDLDYNHSVFWALAYDTISAGGPYLFALERGPQYITRIDPITKKMVAPRHNVADDKPAWSSYYAYGIYVQRGVHSMGEPTLGVFYMSQYHIGYELSSATAPLSQVGVDIEVANAYSSRKTNIPFNIELNVSKAGIDDITSFTVNYRVDGNTYSDAISSVNISSLIKPTMVTNKTAYTPTVNNKTYNMEIWLSNVNNTAFNSDTLTYTFKTYTDNVNRVVLHEVFTSSTCGPCVAGNEQLTKVLKTKDPNNWVCIKYQMNWPGNGDPYYTAEGGTRRTFYGVSAVPDLYADGTYKVNPSSYTTNKLNEIMNVSSAVNMAGTSSITNKTVDLEVTVRPAMNIDNPNIRLFAAIVEKITYNNVASNGETEFHYVMKKFLTNVNGDPIAKLEANTPITCNYSYTFNGNYRLPANAGSPINHSTENSVENFNHLMVVYWLQNTATKEVYQAGYPGAVVAEATVSVIDIALNPSNVSIYPNPAQDVLFVSADVDISQIEIFNIQGQCVRTELDNKVISTTDLASGVYMLRIKTDKGVSTHKFVKR